MMVMIHDNFEIEVPSLGSEPTIGQSCSSMRKRSPWRCLPKQVMCSGDRIESSTCSAGAKSPARTACARFAAGGTVGVLVEVVDADEAKPRSEELRGRGRNSRAFSNDILGET